MTEFKSQGLYIKYWNASGSDPLPSLIPTLWNIGILLYKQAKVCKDMQHSSVHVDRESSDSGAAGTVYFYPNMTEQT